jgi:pilus assembly protein CpaE
MIDEVSLTAMEISDDVYLASAPSFMALHNAKKLLELFTLLEWRESKISVILNSWKRQRNYREPDVVKLLGREIYKVSFDPSHVDQSIDEGNPLGAIAPKSVASEGLKTIVSRLLGENGVRRKGFWSRIKELLP